MGERFNSASSYSLSYRYAAKEAEERASNVGLMDHKFTVAEESKENRRQNVGKLKTSLYHLEIERELLGSIPAAPKNGIAIKV